MNWLPAATAPALVAGVLLLTREPYAAIAAYHALCAAGVVGARKRLRPLFAWGPSTSRWAAGASLLFVACLFLPLLVWDPRSVRDIIGSTLLPGKGAFVFFAAYSMLVHCPLEEIFWRGVLTRTGGAPATAVAGNTLFFYLLHAGGMAVLLGPAGWLLAIPAGLAGGCWAFMTRRSGSLWPALLSHAAVDAAILSGMWFYFIR